MKKQSQKLKLNNVIIAKLDAKKLQQIAGGQMETGVNYDNLITLSFTNPYCRNLTDLVTP